MDTELLTAYPHLEPLFKVPFHFSPSISLGQEDGQFVPLPSGKLSGTV